MVARCHNPEDHSMNIHRRNYQKTYRRYPILKSFQNFLAKQRTLFRSPEPNFVQFVIMHIHSPLQSSWSSDTEMKQIIQGPVICLLMN
jgi:hypothetical protein